MSAEILLNYFFQCKNGVYSQEKLVEINKFCVKREQKLPEDGDE